MRTIASETTFPRETIRLDIDIRLSTLEDIPFICNSWIRSAKNTYPNMYDINFNDNYLSYIVRSIENSITLIACLKDDPNEIIGYLTYSSYLHNQRSADTSAKASYQLIHFSYVKADARRQGVMNKLLTFSRSALDSRIPILFCNAAKNENVMNHLTKKYIFDQWVK